MSAQPSEHFDYLLYALSARGRLALPEFNAAFDLLTSTVLEERRFRYAHLQVARYFDGLGHAEFDYARRQVVVCPPALVALPTPGLPRVVLSGARDARLLPALQRWLRQQPGQRFNYVEVAPTQPELCLPKAVFIEAVAETDLEALALANRLHYRPGAPAAWRLLHFSSSVAQVLGLADFQPRLDFNWPARVFSPGRGHFMPTGSPRPEAALPSWLVEYTNPRTHEQRHWLWRSDGTAALIDRDWGRYAALAAAAVAVLRYDERAQLLAVPDTVPLPTLLARALTLCAGVAPPAVRLPGGATDSPVLILYQGITPAIAQGVATKLSQRLLPVALHTHFPA